jgi:hypothetical protein
MIVPTTIAVACDTPRDCRSAGCDWVDAGDITDGLAVRRIAA